MLIEAVGINPEASRLAGVRSRTIIWTVYAFSGFCAGFAGLVIAANTNSVNANSLGLWIELDAILAVVIGGTSLAGGRFSLTGTLVGALFIATLARTVNNIGIPSELNYLFKAVVVIAVCLLQSPKARSVFRVRRTGGPGGTGGPAPPHPFSPRQVTRMSTATVPADSLWDRVQGYSPPPRYLPVLATLALLIGMFAIGGIRYEGFSDPQVRAEPADRQRLPDRRSPSA